MGFRNVELAEAWTVLGYDSDVVFRTIASLPRDRRTAAAKDMLDRAKKSARRIMAVSHPDRGGDQAKFMAASDAIRTIEANTEDFEAKMKEFISKAEEAVGKRIFIVKD